ncbi:MAG: helix-turn-helix transcriptional regulator [Oscillospiraceae bacterium]|nr:helix-turn-helix transcriptional regulator [Oscillospiraceae bacterium]
MNRIKELRKNKGITQIRLSVELGVTQETISAYENGRHYPTVENLIKMSEIFGVSCDYILGISDVKTIAASGEYSPDELVLISEYRSASPTERKMITAYIQGIKDKRNS